jgi:acyl carrier protein
MNHDTAMAKLTDVFRDIFDDPSLSLTQSTTARDIEEWDSLNQIRLLLACEKSFGVRLKPRDINALENVGDMVDHLLTVIAG